MNFFEVLINPQGEELELGERTLVCSAANILQVGEFQLLQLAYSDWFGRDLPESMIDRLFASYMLRNEVPHWARHFARAILAQDEAGRLDPENPHWHRYDPGCSVGPTPGGQAFRFYAASGLVAVALIGALLASGAATTAPTSLLPPFFDRAHLPDEAASARSAGTAGQSD